MMQSKSAPSNPAATGPAESGITVRVKFLMHFRDLFGAREKDVHLAPGSSMSDLLHYLGDTPERRAALLTGVQVRAQVVVLKNGIPIGDLEGSAAQLFHGDTVAIFPFLAGG
ncbi:MAG: MoaD/ThiS family protein [Acidobacteriota bacterium]|jgi:molybdopterin converting factor small subunit